MKNRIVAVALALLVSCAPTTKFFAGKKCPTPVMATLVDFFLGAALITVGSIKSNAGKSWEGAAFWMPGVVVLTSSYGVEVSCMR